LICIRNQIIYVMDIKRENLIANKSFEFALMIIELYKVLTREKEFVMSKQLLKSATSIGANVEEAGAAQTKRDFIMKMSIASKEARESKYWLRLLDKSQIVSLDYSGYINSVQQIINIVSKIVKTAQESIRTIKNQGYNHSTYNT
jgi:four helix bundle protein